jgi:glycine dehydrogenase subunit 1
MMYIPNRGKAMQEMLLRVGISSVEALFEDIPESVRLRRPLDIPGPMTEWELNRHFQELASKNRPLNRLISFLGGGSYDHHIPAAVKHLLRRSEFYTAYTPYQPEVSQGTLQAMFEFQTFVARLTGMEVANASMYDGASALAEAILMAQRVRRGAKRLILSGTVHPEYRRVVQTLIRPLGLDVEEPKATDTLEADWAALGKLLDSETSCVVVQNPNFFGTIEDLDRLRQMAGQAKKVEALFIVVVLAPLSLGVLVPPGAYGADIVVAEGQSLGIPMAFGGPHLGMFATRGALVRQMPGRMVGQTQDARGRRGYVLTLATREQHIRRERATSNICTNQALCALAATVYLSLLGPSGLQGVGALNLKRAREAMEAVAALPGYRVTQERCFHEFVVRPPLPPAVLNERLLDKGILGGLDLSRFDPQWEGLWMLCCTEQTTSQDIGCLVQTLQEVGQ